jgi:hypothetical protein
MTIGTRRTRACIASFRAGLLALGLGTLAAPPAQAIGNTGDPTIIEDFERALPLQAWRVAGDGLRTAGNQLLSTGSLELAAGYASAQSAVLRYRIGCADGRCGRHVEASSTLARPVAASTQATLSLWVRVQAGIGVVLRVHDASGQTLQYRPRIDTANSGWQRILVPLLPAAEHWGGTIDDGRLHGAILALGLLADTGGRHGATGTLDFDHVRLVEPEAGALIDDFDAEPRGSWSVLRDGARAALVDGDWRVQSDGHAGNGARLHYAFRCAPAPTCGRYVEAVWRPTTPRGGSAPILAATPRSVLSFRVWSKPDVKVTVRVLDGSRQTLQYYPEASTLETVGAPRWQQVVVPLEKAPLHWDSHNDGVLRDGIRGLSILAENRFMQATEGSIRIDDLRLLDAAPDAFAFDHAAAPIAPAANAASPRGRMGVSVHFLNDEKALGKIRDAGFDFIRTDLAWSRVDQPGGYDFSSYDALRQAAADKGLGVLWIVGNPSQGGATPGNATEIKAFAAFAQAAAKRYQGPNLRFEIWNEPDFKTAWRADPAGYQALLRETILALRRGDPSASITTGGLGQINLPFLNKVLEAAAGTNAIGIHPYRLSAPETAAPDLAVLRSIVQRKLGSGVQLWNTEWGYSSYGFFPTATFGDGLDARARKRQAVLAVRQQLTLWTLGLPVNVWYDVIDDGTLATEREHNFGLLDTAREDKTGMKAVRTLTGLGRALVNKGLLPDLPHGLHALRLDAATESLFVVWCDRPDMRLKLSFAKQDWLAALDMLGRPLPVQDAGLQHGAVFLSEADGPIYLRWKR